MTNFLPLLFFLCIQPVCSLFEGMCPRKDPPPGVLAVSPGSRLELTCSGHVKVNGVRVFLTGSAPSKKKRRTLSDRTPTTQQVRRNSVFSTKSDITSEVNEEDRTPTTTAGVSTLQGENQTSGYSVKHTTSPQEVQPTPQSETTTRGELDQEDKEMKNEAEHKDEEWEEGSRVTSGIKMRPQWKWNSKLVQSVGRDWGGMAFLRDGSSLSLSSVRLVDAGKYTCHQRGEETLAVKVIVAEPPETPSISCYKKSPGSKIRCEWRPQKPVIKQPECSLFLSKGQPAHTKFENFHRIPCSYSSEPSRCWCALEQNEDELRTFHMAFLCVTNLFGNATSPMISFTPLDILKPDPPSNVLAQPVERLDRMIKVTWNLPATWRKQDYFYFIIYEIRYRPSNSLREQVREISERQYTITDALPGAEYLISLRVKEEYDGHWSEWTSPVSARSWTAKAEEEGDLTTTMTDFSFTEDYGSGFPDANYLDGTKNEVCTSSKVSCQPQYHILWISALFAVVSILLAVYIVRHRDRFMSKLLSLSATTNSDDISTPPRPVPLEPEGQALVLSSGPQLYKQHSHSGTQEEEENEEHQTEMERLQSTNFNNKSYFFLRMEF